MIRYEFEGSFRSSIAENIRVGFTTTIPKGFLLGLSSNLTGEYLTIQISNSGTILNHKTTLICINNNLCYL